MDKSPQGSVLSVEEELLCKEGGNEQKEEDLVDRQRREAELQGELSSKQETHTALEQKQGLTKKASEDEIRIFYEQELLKLQESLLVTTGKYESAQNDVKLLRERMHHFNENEKQLFSLRKHNKKSNVCVHCFELLKEISSLESKMGITKEVEAVELTPSKALTHDQNEALLKQYVCTLRQLMDIFPKPGEVENLQAEIASLTQTIVLLQNQSGENKPDADVQLLLEQKELDICDLKDIIVKLQAEKTDSLAQLTPDEIKYKSNQEKLRGEVKRTAGQEVDSLNPMINQILLLTERLQKQVAQLKATTGIECDKKFSDIYITTNQLKEIEKSFTINLDLKMSGEDVGNKQIISFAHKVSYLNQHRTDLEQDLIEHLASYIKSNKLQDDHSQNLSELLDNISKENINLQHQIAVKSQEIAQIDLDKYEEISQLQKQLQKLSIEEKLTEKNDSQALKEKDKQIRLLQKQIAILTKEKTEAQKTIIARDEELSNLLTYGDFKITPMKTVPKSVKKALPEAKKPVPTIKKPVLLTKKFVPVVGKSVLAKKPAPEVLKPVTSTKKLVPRVCKPVLAKKPVPEVLKPVTSTKKFVPRDGKLVLAKKPVPEVLKPVLSTQKFVPGVGKPMLSAKKSMSVTGIPVLSAKKPLSRMVKPALSAKKPMSVTGIPVLSAKKSVPEAGKLLQEAKKSMFGAEFKIRNSINIDEELRRVKESLVKQSVDFANLRKRFCTGGDLKKSVSSLPENPTRKTNTPRAATAANMNQKVATAANKSQIPGAATNQKR